MGAQCVYVITGRKRLIMNLTNAQVAGVAVAILGFIFAGAYAVASHHPDRSVQVAPSTAPLERAPSTDPTVPDASVVFKGNTEAPSEQPPTF
jgi:hypothetical protein